MMTPRFRPTAVRGEAEIYDADTGRTLELCHLTKLDEKLRAWRREAQAVNAQNAAVVPVERRGHGYGVRRGK